MDNSLHLVIPMAGEGQRFRAAGFRTPKPLIDVGGMPMYKLVLSNLITPHVSKITLVVRSEFAPSIKTDQKLKDFGIPINLIEVSETTGGPAESVYLAKHLIRSDEIVVIANSDQYVHTDISPFYRALDSGAYSGALLTMADNDPKWSYAIVNSLSEVELVAEKQVISEFATVGIYGFRSGKRLIEVLESMFAAEDKVNGEYYVGPTFNYFDRVHERVLALHLGPVGDVMYGLGTPEDLSSFIANASPEIILNAKTFFNGRLDSDG